ncbi:glutathione peroxidase [Evansella halocellulosilytica]|uniref:glutathione peroxidase n=1 Tax=Evansella halocellulosilytica TaxID=2011013 RepID=UPI000BB6C24A|nr:glutathione peroxidase [Evansella halocellulosilytica]
MSLHDYTATMIDGQKKSLADFKGKVIVVVNTATKCGFAPQFAELERIYKDYKDDGLVIIGFPSNQFMNQEPGSNEEVKQVCSTEYGVTFPLTEKVDVKGPNIHPIFDYLTSEKKGFLNEQIKWNFTKFLVDQNGEVVERYAPKTSPDKIEKDIKKLLNK